MKKNIIFALVLLLLVSTFTGCSQAGVSKIESVDNEVYQRGIDFISYMDKTPMIGEAEGMEMLNAISPDSSPDSDALFEDVIYILWVYHNLKSVESAAEQINKDWKELGVNTTVQEQYKNTKNSILKARTQEDLQQIWDSAGKNK